MTFTSWDSAVERWKAKEHLRCSLRGVLPWLLYVMAVGLTGWCINIAAGGVQ
ncbi:MAG: hypothetical protein WC291_00945 [Thermodesulfovibrionales bacterium]